MTLSGSTRSRRAGAPAASAATRRATARRCRTSRVRSSRSARRRGCASPARRRARARTRSASRSTIPRACACAPGSASTRPSSTTPRRVAIVPMGACFPGLDAKGGDRPPRRECAEVWRAPLLAALPRLELILVIGGYAQAWHLGEALRRPHRDGAALARDPRRAAPPARPAPAAPVLAQQRLAPEEPVVRGRAAAGAAGRGPGAGDRVTVPVPPAAAANREEQGMFRNPRLRRRGDLRLTAVVSKIRRVFRRP